jgi:hypothetical protein
MIIAMKPLSNFEGSSKLLLFFLPFALKGGQTMEHVLFASHLKPKNKEQNLKT